MVWEDLAAAMQGVDNRRGYRVPIAVIRGFGCAPMHLVRDAAAACVVGWTEVAVRKRRDIGGGASRLTGGGQRETWLPILVHQCNQTRPVSNNSFRLHLLQLLCFPQDRYLGTWAL